VYINYTLSNVFLMERENVCISTSPEIEIDTIKLQKMSFIYNALESGWTVKKRKDAYVFTKKHEGKKEIYLDTYLRRFIETNIDINKLI
jgi:hypothetical protein